MRGMTKIYKGIPREGPTALPQFREAQKLFHTFRDNLDSLINKEVLQNHRGREGWVHTALKTALWDFNLALGPLFPTSWNYKTNKHEDSPYELVRERDRAMRRYQKAFRVLIGALNEYLEFTAQHEEGLERRPPIEKLTVAGLQVVLHNEGRDSLEESHLMKAFAGFGRMVRRVRKAGFGKVFDGLVIHMKWVAPTGLRAGQYEVGTDTLTLYPLGFSEASGHGHGTLTHELGHRFDFKFLPNRARHIWEQRIIKQKITVTKEAVDQWIRHLSRHRGLHRVESLLLKLEGSVPSDLYAQFRYLAENHSYYAKTIEQVRADHMKEAVGQKIQTERISDYGETNPREAFAEAFRLYVDHGPRTLGPWTRDFFERITRAGGRGKFADKVKAPGSRQVREERLLSLRRRSEVRRPAPLREDRLGERDVVAAEYPEQRPAIRSGPVLEEGFGQRDAARRRAPRVVLDQTSRDQARPHVRYDSSRRLLSSASIKATVAV